MGRFHATLAFLLIAAASAAAGLASPSVGAAAPHGPRGEAASFPTCAGRRTVLVPPTDHAFHTAYFSDVGAEIGYDANRIRWFQDLSHRRLAGVYFSNHWGRAGHPDIGFPTHLVRTIWRTGAVPMVRMMPWSTRSQGGADPVFTMKRILRGDFDVALRRWFRDARDLRIPLWIEFGVEVNGQWFPWNGRWNGAGTTDAYGDPAWPDGPERFRDAFRHVIGLSRQVGANRLTWAFHVDAEGWPDAWWNRPRWYYPGDGFVDWLAVSDYGEQVPTGKPANWFPFTRKLGDRVDQPRLRRDDPAGPALSRRPDLLLERTLGERQRHRQRPEGQLLERGAGGLSRGGV